MQSEYTTPNPSQQPFDAIAVPLRFVLCDGALLCCPCCGSDCIHLGPVIVSQGRSETYVGGSGTQCQDSDRGKHKRGSAIELRFYCECRHVFAYSFEFHKGSVTCALAARHERDAELCDDLWRDEINVGTSKQLLLFRRPVKAKPRKADLVRNPAAPRDRSWMKSFVAPEVWLLIAEPQQINRSRRRERTS